LDGAGYIPSQSTPEEDVKERHHPYVPSEISGPIPVSPVSSDPHSARQQCCSFHDIYLRSRPPEGTLKEDTDPDEPSQDRSLQDRPCSRCVPIESGIDTYIPFHHEDRRTGDAPPPDQPMRPRMRSQSRPDRKKNTKYGTAQAHRSRHPPMSDERSGKAQKKNQREGAHPCTTPAPAGSPAPESQSAHQPPESESATPPERPARPTM